jgi:hypothetical protein
LSDGVSVAHSGRTLEVSTVCVYLLLTLIGFGIAKAHDRNPLWMFAAPVASFCVAMMLYISVGDAFLTNAVGISTGAVVLAGMAVFLKAPEVW